MSGRRFGRDGILVLRKVRGLAMYRVAIERTDKLWSRSLAGNCAQS
jgi:hypothetical protein